MLLWQNGFDLVAFRKQLNKMVVCGHTFAMVLVLLALLSSTPDEKWDLVECDQGFGLQWQVQFLILTSEISQVLAPELQCDWLILGFSWIEMWKSSGTRWRYSLCCGIWDMARPISTLNTNSPNYIDQNLLICLAWSGHIIQSKDFWIGTIFSSKISRKDQNLPSI